MQKLKSLVKTALVRCFEAWDSYNRLNVTNSNLHRENEGLRKTNEKLAGQNENLRAENKDYKLLRKAFGSKQVDSLLEQAKAAQKLKQRVRGLLNLKIVYTYSLLLHCLQIPRKNQTIQKRSFCS